MRKWLGERIVERENCWARENLNVWVRGHEGEPADDLAKKSGQVRKGAREAGRERLGAE